MIFFDIGFPIQKEDTDFTIFHFGETVRVQKLSGSCRYWKIIEVECTSGKLIDNGFFTESISVLESQNLPIFVK